MITTTAKIKKVQPKWLDLVGEFFELRDELFGDSLFVVEDDSDPRWKRYNELFPIVCPKFATIKKCNNKKVRENGLL